MKRLHQEIDHHSDNVDHDDGNDFSESRNNDAAYDDDFSEPKSKKVSLVDIRSSSSTINSEATSYHSLGWKFKEEKEYGKALEIFMKGAEEKCAQSIYRIGYFYANGLGVERDYLKAMEWYLKASEIGHTQAQVNIGYLYQGGKGVEKDYAKALEWFLKASELGSIEAYVSLGNLYSKGNGVKQDYAKATEWYLKAAERGNASSQFNIGRSYYFGYGIEQDFSKAFEWYLKSAESGNATAQFKVGVLYEKGKGVEEDFKKQVYWKSKSLNSCNFKYLENPLDQFNLQSLIPCNESEEGDIVQVIIRFEERDFTISSQFLKSCKYLTTMMNSNWRDFNSKEKDNIVLDLRSIQNLIFQEKTDHIQVFEHYMEYLTNKVLPIDFDLKLKLIELSKYLQDDFCISQIIKEASILMKLYILLKFESIEPIHIAIASCFVLNESFTMTNLSSSAIETLLNETELSPTSKKHILDHLITNYNKFPNSIVFNNNNIIHLQILKRYSPKVIEIRNEKVDFTLRRFIANERDRYNIICSHDSEFFGEDLKIYVQLNTKDSNIGFWMEGKFESKCIIRLPIIQFESIDVVILIGS